MAVADVLVPPEVVAVALVEVWVMAVLGVAMAVAEFAVKLAVKSVPNAECKFVMLAALSAVRMLACDKAASACWRVMVRRPLAPPAVYELS